MKGSHLYETTESMENQESFDLKRIEVMTDEEMTQIDNYLTILSHNESSLSDFFKDWEDIEDKYCNEQPEDEDKPNSRMNVIVSTVEGMVTQIVDKNINCVTQGVGPEDESFANTARTGLNWIFSRNDITDKMEAFVRRRLKFGVAWLKVVFDKEFAGGFGLSKIQVVPNNKVFVDNKVKDVLRLQEAEYIAETINLSKAYAEQVYGYEKAEIIKYGFNEFLFNEAFEENYDVPDCDRQWTLIQWWSRYEGMLRLQEFSSCGVLLYDSHKAGDRKDNQKNSSMDRKSIYKYVSDEYPYFLTVKYPKEGFLYGFGDGKLLDPIQNLINELFDKIRIQARPNLIGIDSHSDIDIEDFDDNSFEPRYYNGAKLQNRPFATSVPWGAVNRDMYELLERVRVEMQRIVRYSDLMMGQSKTADTATEAAIQQQQGNSHVDWEKGVVERLLARVGKYCICLMMEFSKTGKSLRIGEDNEEYDWVDFRQFAEIPVQKPATKGFQDQYKDSNPGAPIPKYENVTEKGKDVTKNLDLDLTISVGSGLPKNPAFLWSMIEKLSQLMVIDTDVQPPVPKPAINFKEMRKFLKDFLGIPIRGDEQMKKFIEEFKKMQLQMMQQKMKQGMGTNMGPNPSVPGEQAVMGPGGPGGNQPAEQPETAGLTVAGDESALNNPAGVGGGFRHG